MRGGMSCACAPTEARRSVAFLRTRYAVFDKLPVPAGVVDQVKAQFVAQVPLGRMASSDEVAHWIAAMVDPAVTWMTGEILAVDGGMSLT